MADTIEKVYCTFQFHKGTIRTDSDFVSQIEAHLFQFHKGTIRTAANANIDVLKSHFNSIKVQLELKYTAKTYGVVIFQFHKGTIRTLGPCLNCGA